MATKHELAMRVAEALGRPGDDATIAAYQILPIDELQLQADKLPGVVARLRAEGHWDVEAKAVQIMNGGLEECELCGEDADGEMGEFTGGPLGVRVVAHAQCGLDAGLPLA